MPVLGIIASSYGTLTGSYESIASYAPTTASVTFSSIPQTYKHLELRISGRVNIAAYYTYLKMRFNGSSASDYSFSAIKGDGNSAAVYAYTGQSYCELNYLTGTTIGSVVGSIVVQIPNYTNTTYGKTLTQIGGWGVAGAGIAQYTSTSWSPSTSAAISSILVASPGGEAFIAGTKISLYGIKG